MRWARALLCLIAVGGACLSPPAHAVDTPVTAGGYTDFGCNSAPGNNGGGCAGLQRPANTTAYSVGQLVCSTPCVPLQILAGRRQEQSAGSGLGLNVKLLKSGSSTTNASFNVFFFSAPPTFPSLADQSAYAGPYAADITSGIYIGSVTCSTANNTSDTTAEVYYNCEVNEGGILALALKTTNKILYATIETTGAYAPSSGEKFYVTTYELQD
jgi:hypothetical protein